MSEMSTQPIYKCRYCGRPVVVTHLSTATADPEGRQLFEMMKGLATIAMCDDCRNAYNYYASQGRSQDFIAGRP